MTWDHRKYATRDDPFHQSHLSDLASQFGCARRFQLRRQAEAAGEDVRLDTAPGPRLLGTAVHHAVDLYLADPTAFAKLHRGIMPSEAAIVSVIRRMLDVEADGRPVDWRKSSEDKELKRAACMVYGALHSTAERARKVYASEATFTVGFETRGKTYYAEGTIDLIFEPVDRPGEIDIADWKTGKAVPQVVIDHGYQPATYFAACQRGEFDKSVELPARPPSKFWMVQLADFVPYERAQRKECKRPEESAFYGVALGGKVSCKAGDLRGPGWYASRRTAADEPRFVHSLRTLISGVRLGVFNETIDTQCNSCAFKSQCLNAGHGEVRDDLRRDLEASLRALDADGVDYETDLSA